MNKHLEHAKLALEGPGRTGGTPNPEAVLTGMYTAIKDMLKYLEELDESPKKPRLTVNNQ